MLNITYNRGTDSKVQGGVLALSWYLAFNNLLNQTLKELQKQD
jgi:hypothetical protein